MHIETKHEQAYFLSQLSQILSQIITQIPKQVTNGTAAILPIDISKSAQATCPPWTPYTCTITSGAGTITAQTSNASFLQIGKLVFLNGGAQITNIGTASGNMYFSFPVATKRTFSFAFRESGVSGLTFGVTVGAGGTTAQVNNYANAIPTWANNFNISVAVAYEAA